MKKELELYVHIPFCVRKCKYCDFLSEPATAQEIEEYIELLVAEIKAHKKEFQEYTISTIFVGGGTPSILNEREISRLFEMIYETFSVDEEAEITLEVNPGTADQEKMNCWKELGINRLSIGLQSANNDELKMLGRIHTFEQFEDTYYMARTTGFHNINIDLISAIPGQNIESWKETLLKTVSLKPEHISAYSLIIEEGTPFFVQYESLKPMLPSEDEERRIYEETELLLNRFGYYRYEISNYAQEGMECRHNCGYWQRKEYLGVGLGASSLIDHYRFSVINDRKQYKELNQNRIQPLSVWEDELYENQEELSPEDEMEEFMFLGLRMMEGISKNDFQTRFQKSIDTVYGEVIDDLKQKQLIKESEDRIWLTKRGIDLSNTVFAEFLL